MRLLYILPGNLSHSDAGRAEIERRRAILRRLAAPGTAVDAVDVPDGPLSIESAYEEYLAVPGTLRRVQEAEQAGYDGVIIGCFGDPGVDAARELVALPVVGPAEASMLLAATLGHRFSIVTVLDSVVAPLRYLAARVGLVGKLASVRAVDIPVLELARNRDASIDRMIAMSRRAVQDDGADVLVLGCMSMGFLQAHTAIADAIGVPVVNPVVAAVKLLEALVGAGLRHSKKAYPVPPKLRAPLPANSAAFVHDTAAHHGQ
ncbi:MAG: aspartate/glutamate racemase family protein [Armatimonadota bacterium]|nr:aspartate/glutamate racemase family protein [Armatimonadota bacterium]